MFTRFFCLRDNDHFLFIEGNPGLAKGLLISGKPVGIDIPLQVAAYKHNSLETLFQ